MVSVDMQYELFEPSDWPSFWLIDWHGPGGPYPELSAFAEYLICVMHVSAHTAIKAAMEMLRSGEARLPLTPRAMTTFELNRLGVGVTRPGQTVDKAPRPAGSSGPG